MKKISLLVLTTLFLLASCSREKLEITKDHTNGKEVQAHFTFSTAPMQYKGLATRSTPAANVNDTQITDIWVLQFDATSGAFIKKIYSSFVDVNAFDAALVANATGTTSNIYFIANNGPTLPSPATEAAFKTQVKALASESDFMINGAESKKSIPMFGQLLAKFVPATGYLETMNVSLTRMLAEVDLTYTLDASIASTLVLEQVRLCNIPTSMQYYTPAAGNFPVTPTPATVFNLPVELATSPGPTTVTFFVPENRRGVGTNTAGTNERLKSGVEYATYIELIGHTRGPNGGDEVSYRIYPGADNYNDYNIVRNTKYTLSTTLKGVSASDNRVHIKERSNCYMVKPGQTIFIPAKHANDSDLGTQLPDVTTGWTPAINWQTVSGLVTINGATSSLGYFKVTAPSTTATGNAEVMIKDGSNKVLWSWHIWVTNYDPSFAANVDVMNGNTWMRQNLGALYAADGTSYATAGGLFYEWGRKDPFPNTTITTGGNTSVITIYDFVKPSYSELINLSGGNQYMNAVDISYAPISNVNQLAYSVKYPMLFLYSWAGSTATKAGDGVTGNDSWGGEYGQPKSVYDPCPEGWRVPSGKKTSSSWINPWIAGGSVGYSTYFGTYGTDGYSTSNYSYFLNYPLSGFIHPSNAYFYSAGSVGFYWSATALNASAYCESLAQTSYSETSANRYYGQNIRCAKVW